MPEGFYDCETYNKSSPINKLNPEVKDFYKFTVDDIRIEDYVAGPQIKNIPIAV